MLTTERHILKSLKIASDKLPEFATDIDHRFVIEATSAAMTALIEAEEPINKTHQYHAQARRITDDLEAFIQHRQKENWSANTTYVYDSYRVYGTKKKKREA